MQVVLIELVLIGGVGCAGSGAERARSSQETAASDDQSSTHDRDNYDPDVITQEEIQAAGTTTDVYSLLQRLEPSWLHRRGRSSISEPSTVLVYVDDTRYGPPSALRDIQVINVESIEFLNAGEATLRYGSGHEHGVILLESKRGR